LNLKSGFMRFGWVTNQQAQNLKKECSADFNRYSNIKGFKRSLFLCFMLFDL